MAEEIRYRLLAGEGIQIDEDSGTRTATISVPGLSSKLNIGDVGQASVIAAGIVELATDAEARAGVDTVRAITPGALHAAAQASMYDASAGRFLKVGAFGLGAQLISVTTDINALQANGIYRAENNVNAPGLGSYMVEHLQATTTEAVQFASRVGSDEVWFRRRASSVWTAWRQVYHSGNFDPSQKANIIGTYPTLNCGDAATLSGQTAAMLSPPGAVMMFARNTPPSGWLKANGAQISRTTYAALFAAIGTTWGAGNGSTTFNLPDLRGEFLRGWDDGRGVDSNRAFANVQSGQNLSHSHGGVTGSSGSHNHNVYGQDNGAGPTGTSSNEVANVENAGSATAYFSRTTSTVGAHAHNINSDGGNEARPRNVSLLTCIKY